MSKASAKTRIVIAAGGSGGHIFPAISLARRLRDRERQCDILFVGSNKSLDRRIFEKNGFNYKLLSTNKLPYRASFALLMFFVKLTGDLLHSLYIICRYRPDVVVSFGGYVASPIALAGFLLKVPVLTHEQNVVPGRANKILFKLSRVVALSFDETRGFMGSDSRKAVLTGNPIRPEIFRHDRAASMKKFGLREDKFTILIVGGSQGAHRLNEIFIKAFAGFDQDMKARLQVVHLTGLKDHEWAAAEYGASGIDHRVYSFIDTIEEAYSVSDLVVTRSGASALFEIAFFAKPMIVVPYPFAMSHQSQNAAVFSKNRAAIQIEERDLSEERVRNVVKELVHDDAKRSQLAESARRMAFPESSDILASHVLRLAKSPVLVKERKHVHFVGIGGIGMSGIALVLLEMGYRVSGSDAKLSGITKKLEEKGAAIYEGHRASNLPKTADIVVYSSAATQDNPELVEASRRRLAIVQRAEILSELFNAKSGIAVSGMHGKTTTTSLISVMLENCGNDPTVIIGGEVERFKGNAKLGKSRYFVAEADESDASFLHLTPLYAVITNVELEHLDYYKTLDDVISSYAAFAQNIKDGGCIFRYHDDDNIRKVLAHYKGQVKSYGFSKEATIYPADIEMDGFSTSFGCVYNGQRLGTVDLSIPGRHNVLNALATILVGLHLGFGFDDIARSIKDFRGTKRRFHLRADVDGVMLIDDYAHHPTEIRAVLDACRNWKERRLIAIFQPHRYTRTLHLADDFGRCFTGVDKLILTDIYAASEAPIEGVSVKTIYDKVKANGLADVEMMKKEDITEYVMKNKRRGDMIVVLGAGDVKDVANELSERMNGALVK